MTKERIQFKEDNPNGLHVKYVISKVVKTVRLNNDFFGSPQFKFITKPVEPNSEYFVLRLDENGDDINHIRACRIAIHAYADAIEPFIPQLAEDLRNRYPILKP
jgi:hypothetical protein